MLVPFYRTLFLLLLVDTSLWNQIEHQEWYNGIVYMSKRLWNWGMKSITSDWCIDVNGFNIVMPWKTCLRLGQTTFLCDGCMNQFALSVWSSVLNVLMALARSVNPIFVWGLLRSIHWLRYSHEISRLVLVFLKPSIIESMFMVLSGISWLHNVEMALSMTPFGWVIFYHLLCCENVIWTFRW